MSYHNTWTIARTSQADYEVVASYHRYEIDASRLSL